MKKFLLSAIVYIVLGLTCFLLFKSNQALRADRDLQVENRKAYELLYSNSENEKLVFKLSIDQLKASKDSIFQKMVEAQKELKIKDRKISQLQYRLSTATRVDTIRLRDTIFKDPGFELDTVFGDKWFTQRLHLKYPGEIASSPQITLENYVALSDRKETVKPRKKFFLWRLFQRKQTVTEVEVIERNKYVRDSISRFVIINK